MAEADCELPSKARDRVRTLWRQAYGEEDLGLAEEAWNTLETAFSGDHPRFEAIDAPYHDLDHTHHASLCYAKLVSNNQKNQTSQPLSLPIAQLGLLAILFHDTGYLKDRGDKQGTGAKYSFYHVKRSQDFASDWMSHAGMDEAAATQVRAMIQCTQFGEAPSREAFASEAHFRVGCMVGTADLLGQMAASDYIEKLPSLHAELVEAKRHADASESPIRIPDTPEALLQLTPRFFHEQVLPRLEQDYQGVFRLFNDPYPEGPNAYLEKIESNLGQIAQLPRR